MRLQLHRPGGCWGSGNGAQHRPKTLPTLYTRRAQPISGTQNPIIGSPAYAGHTRGGMGTFRTLFRRSQPISRSASHKFVSPSYARCCRTTDASDCLRGHGWVGESVLVLEKLRGSLHLQRWRFAGGRRLGIARSTELKVRP